MQEIGKCCPLLGSLKLSHCRGVTTDALRALADCCPQLESLNLQNSQVNPGGGREGRAAAPWVCLHRLSPSARGPLELELLGIEPRSVCMPGQGSLWPFPIHRARCPAATVTAVSFPVLPVGLFSRCELPGSRRLSDPAPVVDVQQPNERHPGSACGELARGDLSRGWGRGDSCA